MTDKTTLKYNPYDFFLNETKYDSEWTVRSIIGFAVAKQFADTMYRTQQKKLIDSDFEVREVLFTGKYPKGNIKYL